MTMNCPHCRNVIECDIDLVCGQRVLCPYCETKFVYDGGSGVVMRIRRPGCSGDIGMIINVNQPDEVLAAKAYEAFMDGDLEKASRYAEAIRDEASRIMLVSTFKGIERAKEEARAEDALTDEEGARARAAADSIHEDSIMSIGN